MDLHIDKYMNQDSEKAKIRPVELLDTGVVSIPYSINNEKFEIIIYKEANGYKHEVKELKSSGWKVIKKKEDNDNIGNSEQKIINEKNFNAMIGKILDYYVAKFIETSATEKL